MPWNEAILLTHLEELAYKLHVDLRFEPFSEETGDSNGGLCRFKGRYLLIVNSKAPKKDQIQTITNALRHFDLTNIYVRPALREWLNCQNRSI